MFNTILVQPLFNLLAGIYAIIPGHDFGIAVIILTAIIRIILWPIVAKQLHSQRALQQLQPEVARIRTQAKGDKQLESKLLMELYKEKEINPFASLLPLIIQLPVFLALYAVLRNIIKMGEIAKLAYEPIRQLGPIADILAHGGVFHPTFLGIINMAKPSIPLALLAGAAQYFQTRQIMPAKSKGGDAQAQAMASMTYIFPVLTAFIGFTLPSALALYWIATSAFAIGQQTLILRQDVEELEESSPELPPASSEKLKKLKGSKP